LTYNGVDVKSGCKDSDYFWICNKMFCFTPFLLKVIDAVACFRELKTAMLTLLWMKGAPVKVCVKA
jgi:hypothetical protein